MGRNGIGEITPQPGAVAGSFVPNGLPWTDVSNKDDPSWPTLPAREAVNFVSAAPVTIGPPTTAADCVPGFPLHRIWGDPAWDVGRYWTLAKPDTEASFYADAAVALNWNSGTYAAVMLNAGSATRIKAWSGPAARQPAMGI